MTSAADFTCIRMDNHVPLHWRSRVLEIKGVFYTVQPLVIREPLRR